MPYGVDEGDDINVKGDDGSSEGVRITATTDGSKKRLDTSTTIGEVTLPEGLPIAPYPTPALVPLISFAVESGSMDLNVDGSSTPVVFKVCPPTGETWYINTITLSLTDNGTNNNDDFGAITNGLTAGLKMAFKIDSTEHVFYTFKTNLELAHVFVQHHMTGRTGGFLNDPNTFVGTVNFEDDEVTIKESQSDCFEVTVQDDLTGLNHLHISLMGYKIP
jgi:hypothetical protein